MSKKNPPWHAVRQSPLHGNGIFAARDIPAGTRIIEYTGTRITPEQADERHPVNPDDPFHTFYFALSSGKVIDGGDKGNDARWINHSCAPNCETEENASGTRVYVMALRDIAQGDELFYDYGLVMDGKITKKLQAQYRCLCGNEGCRGTMLALPKKKPKSGAKAAKDKTDKAQPGHGKKDKQDKKAKADKPGQGKKKPGKKKKKDAPLLEGSLEKAA